jgi:hypothetical protein
MLILSLTKHHSMKIYEVQILWFFAYTLEVAYDRSASSSGSFDITISKKKNVGRHVVLVNFKFGFIS